MTSTPKKNTHITSQSVSDHQTANESFEHVKLPTWLNRGLVLSLAYVFEAWWDTVKNWLSEPLRQINPDTCTLGMLNLIASSRNVERFAGEPEGLYRLRVKFAHINAVDAGSVAGIKRIFFRLGVGYVEVRERVDGRDWDMIILELSDAQLSGNQPLLELLLRKYGRTCRRYEFNVISSVELGLSISHFDHDWYFDTTNLGDE